MELNNDSKNEEVKKKAKRKGLVHGFNLLFLVFYSPVFFYVLFNLILFLIVGAIGIHTALGLLAVLGEGMMIWAFALSSKREKAKRELIIQEEEEREKWYKRSEFKEIILGLSGFILAVTVSIILITLEYDFW